MSLTFAVGDVHGCRKQLEELVDECLSTSSAGGTFVFLGDYVDRGPDSRGVVDFLLELSESHPCYFLMGNHEDMLLRHHSGFLGNGGVQTMMSYGCRDYEEMVRPDVARTYFPREHLEFFERALPYHHDGTRTYVHAGIGRGVHGLENQPLSTLLWVRREFLNDERPDGGYVVHGHTPMENGDLPCEMYNRINLDTGCVFGGKLTAGIFEPGHEKPVGFVQVPGWVNRRTT